MSIYSLPLRRDAILALRLALSAVLLALFLGLVRLAWYPGLYFQLGGVGRQILILTAVILVIGPGLSTLVYKPGKRGLKNRPHCHFLEPRLVNARFPDDQAERAALKEGILLHGEADIDIRPDHWYPYVDAIPAVLAAARPLAELSERGAEYSEAVDRWLSWHSGGPSDYLFLPVAGAKQDGVAVLSAAEGHLIDMLDLYPSE